MISNSTIKELIAYFNAKENRTEQEENFLGTLSIYQDAFPITAVSRDDLGMKGFDVAKISDSDMERLAEKMSDDYCDQLFWDSMDIIADECMGLPKINND